MVWKMSTSAMVPPWIGAARRASLRRASGVRRRRRGSGGLEVGLRGRRGRIRDVHDPTVHVPWAGHGRKDPADGTAVGLGDARAFEPDDAVTPDRRGVRTAWAVGTGVIRPFDEVD